MSVSCSRCGYLAVRHRVTRQLLEAEIDVREQGYLLTESPATGGTVFERYPVCFANAVNFLTVLGRTPNQERVRGEVRQVRSCEKYTEWSPGLSPKEHWEMIQEADRLKWQTEREEADRKWREHQSRLDHEWRQQEAERSQQAISQAHKHHIINLIVMGLLVTVVGAAAQLLAAMIERGLIAP